MLTNAECLLAYIIQILGQFNLGFIIARLDDDLYILDQHACDEKYRYETLQKTTRLALLAQQLSASRSANGLGT